MIFKKFFSKKPNNTIQTQQDETSNNNLTNHFSQTTPTNHTQIENQNNINTSISINQTTENCVITNNHTSWFNKLKNKLKKSSSLLGGIFNLFANSEIDYCQIEEMLINFDFDYELTQQIIEKIKTKDKWNKLDPSSARELMKQFMIDILQPHYKSFDLDQYIINDNKAVIIFCGINGSGKTTSIAKIASLYNNQTISNKSQADQAIIFKPLMVACDSFRAAAKQQLKIWADNLSLPIFFGANNNLQQIEDNENNGKYLDPASIAFSSIEYADKHDNNLLLIDTSGRLHNNKSLMDELSKINRVLGKINPNFAQEVILVLDGTMGQNLKDQFEKFNQAVKITGLIITKLDGVARGGIILSLVHQYKIPVYFIGIGEKPEDINFFKVEEFVESILEK